MSGASLAKEGRGHSPLEAVQILAKKGYKLGLVLVGE